jgi:hypothetical protein
MGLAKHVHLSGLCTYPVCTYPGFTVPPVPPGAHLFSLAPYSFVLSSLMTADFGAAVVLISMGAMLGKLSPVQYLVMAFIETTIGHIAEHVIVEKLHVSLSLSVS